ncbi:MAG: hypothetical protein K0Q63_2424, partial [Paenibacillus sp.]|nr:hypothetical protein [Paenibacillus sp.]
YKMMVEVIDYDATIYCFILYGYI